MKKLIIRSLSAGVFTRILVIATSLFVVRNIGLTFQEDTLALWLFLSFLLSFQTFIDFGSIMKTTSDLIINEKLCYSSILSRGISDMILSVFLMTLGLIPIVYFYFGLIWYESVSPILIVLYISVFALSYPLNIVEAYLVAEEKFYYKSLLRAVPTLFSNLSLLFYMANEDWTKDLKILLIIHLLSFTITRLAGAILILKRYKLVLRINFDLGKYCEGILDRSKYFLVQFLSFLTNNIDLFLLSIMLGGGELAFILLWRKIFFTTQIGQYFVTALWPHFGRMIQLDLRSTIHNASNAGTILWAANFILFVIVYLFIGEYINNWFGIEKGVSSIEILMMGLAIASINWQATIGTLFNNASLVNLHVKTYVRYTILFIMVGLGTVYLSELNILYLGWTGVMLSSYVLSMREALSEKEN